MNRSWYLFYGRKLGMSKREVLATPYGEMLDMIACLSIYEGNAKPKKEKMKFEDIMKLR